MSFFGRRLVFVHFKYRFFVLYGLKNAKKNDLLDPDHARLWVICSPNDNTWYSISDMNKNVNSLASDIPKIWRKNPNT